MNFIFAQSVRAASLLPGLRAAIQQLYQSLQSQIDLRKPLCQSSGRCCHFDEFGHRLFITTAEMATFLHDLPAQPPSPNLELRSQSLGLKILPQPATSPGCCFQRDGLCSVHAIRPFGCRIFFCDASSTQWQQDQYEIFHARLKQIHEQFQIPYFYMEWRTALAVMGW